jgi:DNA-binding transcriptional LysR family regulator
MSGEFLPATLSRFAQTYPHVEVSLKEIGPDEQIAQLENNQIQIAFTLNPAIDSWPTE